MRTRSQKISERDREIKRVRQAGRRAADRRSGEHASEAEGRLVCALESILESPRADVLSFLAVAGIPDMLDRVPPERFLGEFVRHYTGGDGTIDEARFATDFSIWPPIASRVAEIRAGRG